MAAVFNTQESEINLQVGTYEQFPRPGREDAPAAAKTWRRHLHLVLLSFGLLCVLQAVLNISLRLAAMECSPEGEAEERPPGCPPGWLQFGVSCYYVSSQRRSWDDSRSYCRERGADLVVINGRLEQALLTGFTEVAWVGMTDRETEGVWVWVDGTPVDKNMLLWARGQPDDAFVGEDCGDLRTMIDFIGLNDYECGTKSQWICEKTLPSHQETGEDQTPRPPFGARPIQ